jgi:hypothetical protein
MEKEVVYNVEISTEKEIFSAEALQAMLYDKYNSVKVYTIGLCKIKIVASN